MSAGIDQGSNAAETAIARSAGNRALAARRFAAFISYAHADEGVAARLQKQIETYRLPTQLRDLDGSAADNKLGAIFRDRADLAAADSLSAAIRTALADSGALIVLCSPAAVQSRWVNEEIRLFRDLNPGAPVLAAVVHGEPASAMPAALTEGGREPLAADLRQEGDGRKLGFLKIVAALAGVPLDALIQRDAQRKLRRVMAVTVSALLALIAAVAMMTYAIQQRNEANRQRAQAEGLVEFMLTDLRERLSGVGRLDIMTAVNARAQRVYAQDADLSVLPPESLARRARLLHAMGQDDGSLGEWGAAETKFREAHRATSALLRRDPESPDRIYDHAQSEFYLGRVAMAQGHLEIARQHWERYRDHALHLQRVDPDRLRALREVGFAFGNICTVLIAQNGDALASCRAALRAMEQASRLAPGDPALQQDLGNRHAWVGEVLEQRGALREALVHREQQMAIARQLVRSDTQNFRFADALVAAHLSMAQTLFRLEDTGAAQAVLARIRPELRRLRERDPDNERWTMLEARAAAMASSGPLTRSERQR